MYLINSKLDQMKERGVEWIQEKIFIRVDIRKDIYQSGYKKRYLSEWI